MRLATEEFCQICAASASINRHHAGVTTLRIETAEGIEIQTELAGVGSRMAAALLDLILIVAGYLTALMMMLLLAQLWRSGGMGIIEGISDFAIGLVLGGGLLLVPGYFILFHIFWNGQTPGKRALRIRVVDAGGSGAGTLAFILRGLIWPIDALITLPIPIGLMMISLDSRCRRLGDMAAGTLVLCEAKTSNVGEPWPEETWRDFEAKGLGLSAGMGAKLGKEDLSIMRDAICRKEVPRTYRQTIYKQLVEHYKEKLGLTLASSNERVNLKELYLFARESRRE
ncbi:MAG: putative RDD family membrane protein YckC [Planctomycetota bacterium]